ncbi:hypothetical protein [Chamaesiphon minutus]|uniref:Uncharacterized protein n=1 Tax=Chamaesiphon minutus (strain ATCC 27169 / PCC 6605) TaxID=1173020 RepID=K9UAH4_CHAP6|nr:hypothetical protein [Chamaesiphon minutus]AFY92117.1 hypothetical protein Cha6605_0856 [Chamaesiphon minutus PCC 6605]
MLELQSSTDLASSTLDRVTQLLHSPVDIETDRHYLDKHLQGKMDWDKFAEIYPIPPYDDPLY